MTILDRPITVRVFGVPTAGNCDCQQGWRDAAEWVGRSLKAYFGDQVCVEYQDVFTDHDVMPQVLEMVARGEAQPPIVFIGDEIFSSGGRISGPAIRKRLEALGVEKLK